MQMQMNPDTHVEVAIIGSGFAGLGAAIQLKRDGREDFALFERADEVGGVWRDNRYPGCTCDVSSHLYSFSFAPNPDWSHVFARREEIWDYLKQCTADFGIRPHIRFGCTVEEARWDEEAQRWALHTSDGRFTAGVLVGAVGGLSEPLVPELPGQDRFEGRAFHSARWDTDFDFEGKRVAVLGTGASGIQAVPAIQPEVKHLTLFQRTAPWVTPKGDGPISEKTKERFRRHPWLLKLRRKMLYAIRETFGLAFRHPWLAHNFTEHIARGHLKSQIDDPALREKLTPDYTMGCKRVLLSDDYYPALAQPNAEVVAGGAKAVTPRGVVGPDGTEHKADAIVYCTGFHVTDFPFGDHVYGRGRHSLRDVWGKSFEAHLGTTVAGFPNFFILQGPNTGLGHNSVLLMIEAQIEHFMNAMRFMDARGVEAVEPRPEAQAAFVEEVAEQMQGTVWVSGGCDSWYLDETGRNSTLWPGSVGSFRRRVAPFDPEEYRLNGHALPRAEPSANGAAGVPMTA